MALAGIALLAAFSRGLPSRPTLPEALGFAVAGAILLFLLLLFATGSRRRRVEPMAEEGVLWRLRRDPGGSLGLHMVLAMFSIALLAPLLSPFPADQMVAAGGLPPSFAHVLGTDLVGRDLLSRLLAGAPVSLTVAGLTVLLSTGLGTLVGLVAGQIGGFLDDLLMWLVDFLLALPRLILLVAVLGLLGGTSGQRLAIVVVLLGLTGWMDVARLVRAQVVEMRNKDYILACRGLGLPLWRLLFRHVLPGVLPILAVNAALAAGTTILAESALSFLNIGVGTRLASWGSLVQEGREVLALGWLYILAPGGCIVLLVVAFNLLAEGLRRALDPRGEART
jgi:peptide/nickel transport system permease protein